MTPGVPTVRWSAAAYFQRVSSHFDLHAARRSIQTAKTNRRRRLDRTEDPGWVCNFRPPLAIARFFNELLSTTHRPQLCSRRGRLWFQVDVVDMLNAICRRMEDQEHTDVLLVPSVLGNT